MFNIKHLFLFIKITGITTGLFFCACIQSPKDDESISKSSRNQVGSTIITNDEKTVLYLIPSPGEILMRFQEAEVIYNKDLINPVSDKNKYFGSKAQSLNLGVYITDLAYLTLLQRAVETVDYLETIQYLSYEIGISSSVFESFIKRAKENAGKMDSLFVIYNETYYDLIEFLEEGGKENTIILISAGAYIECLYLALLSAGEYSPDNKVLGFIADMRYPLDNILERAKMVSKDDSGVDNIINNLNAIKTTFNELEYATNGITVRGDKKDSLSIQGGERSPMNEQVFNKLMQIVPELRYNIISN